MPRESYGTCKIVTLLRSFLHADRATTWSVILYLILTMSLQGQERVRSSAEEPLIESFRRPPDTFVYFGPFQEVLSGSVGVQYTDNVNLTATDKISDLSFPLTLALKTTWVLSHLNQIQFNFGGQIAENLYGNGRSQLIFAIAPNSDIELKLAVSDLLFRFYDQFSYDQNPTTNPTATNTANLNSFSNTIGAAVDDDLNIAVLSFSGDYTYNDQSGTNVQGQANPSTTGSRESLRFGPSLTFRLSPTITYGVTGDATRSTGANSANVNSLSFGPFIKGKLSRDFEFDLSVGGTLVDTKPAIPPGYYFSTAIRYQINRHWQLLFSASHDLIFTTGTGLTEENVFRAGTELDLTRLISFSVSPFINLGDVKTTTQGAANTPGSYTQFGIGASLNWKPRRRWSTALNYNFIRRESGGGTGSDNYIQNTISLQIMYGF